MKKQDFKELPLCLYCNNPAVTLHELWSGHGIRDIAIAYDLQTPVCFDCHSKAHKNKEVYQEKTCKIYKINRDLIQQIIQKSVWNEYEKHYMNNVSKIIRKYFEEYMK